MMPSVVMVNLNPMGRAAVQRDMEVVRAIFASVQARGDLRSRSVELEGHEEWIVQRHLELLLDSGFLAGTKSEPLSQPYPTVLVRDLTWQGHDFAATLSNETVWGKMKQSLSAVELATLPLTVLKDVGTKLLVAYTTHKLGLGGA